MDLSARQLRTGLRSPTGLARQMRLARATPIDPDTPRSAQRLWMNASIRRYEDQGRVVEVLLNDYDRRTSCAKRRDTAASEIANGRIMLARFASLDLGEPAPSRIQMKPVAVDALGIRISMGVDLAYQTPDGWVVRHLLTDSEITRLGHLRLYATAAALHFEGRPDGGRVVRVELWLLRYQDRVVGWPRSLPEASIPSLAARLDEIARGAAGQAA